MKQARVAASKDWQATLMSEDKQQEVCEGNGVFCAWLFVRTYVVHTYCIQHILYVQYVYICMCLCKYFSCSPTPHTCMQVVPSAARAPLEKRDNNVVLKNVPPPQPEKEQVRVSECMTVAIGADHNVVSIILRPYTNVIEDPVVFESNMY